MAARYFVHLLKELRRLEADPATAGDPIKRRPDLHSAQCPARPDRRHRLRGGAVDLRALLRPLPEEHPLVEGRFRLIGLEDASS